MAEMSCMVVEFCHAMLIALKKPVHTQALLQASIYRRFVPAVESRLDRKSTVSLSASQVVAQRAIKLGGSSCGPCKWTPVR